MLHVLMYIHAYPFNVSVANDSIDEQVVIAIDNGKSAPTANAKKLDNTPPVDAPVSINATPNAVSNSSISTKEKAKNGKNID